MAIYKYGEYFEAYPNRIRAKNIFDRFSKTEKDLHTMSIEEINAITSTWDKLAYTTVEKIRKEIKLYFDWLAESGIKVDLNVYKKMDIPTKANEYLVCMIATNTLQIIRCLVFVECRCRQVQYTIIQRLVLQNMVDSFRFLDRCFTQTLRYKHTVVQITLVYLPHVH